MNTSHKNTGRYFYFNLYFLLFSKQSTRQKYNNLSFSKQSCSKNIIAYYFEYDIFNLRNNHNHLENKKSELI